MSGSNTFCARPACGSLVLVAGTYCPLCRCVCGLLFEFPYDETNDAMMRLCFGCQTREPALEVVR